MVEGKLRWRLADEQDGSGQIALFDEDETVERHVGTGEFRGMEFLHVNAKTVINEVPAASQMPFRYTINVYRGCSHACTYCLWGETPILMADGRTKALADVRVGDSVYGTVRQGNYRRYVATSVLAHWSTVKQAYRITLADGTELIASGDHRFLTDRGWKHVTGTQHGSSRRPHLTTRNKLVGTGSFSPPPKHTPKFDTDLRVRSIEPLGLDLPMFDITTRTGDFIANGVVSHNCFARPTHEYLGLNIGEDFERRIVVKVNAVEVLRAELAARRWGGHHIAMGTNTDPYQRCEGKYHLTQGVVRALGEAANPFSILTKSTLILRDLDLLAGAARRTEVRANFSIGTLDEKVWRLTEPGTPPPRKRVEAVRRLNDAGVPCGVLVAPVIPGMSDSPEQLEEVVTACVDAGAESISAIPLHLRPGVREHFLGWLGGARPDLLPGFERRYRRAYLPSAEQRELSSRVAEIAAKARRRNPRRGRYVRPSQARSEANVDQPGVGGADPPVHQLGLEI